MDLISSLPGSSIVLPNCDDRLTGCFSKSAMPIEKLTAKCHRVVACSTSYKNQICNEEAALIHNEGSNFKIKSYGEKILKYLTYHIRKISDPSVKFNK